MLRVEAIVSGGIVPVSKRWSFEESGENSRDAAHLRRLLDDSGFWSHPCDTAPCHPDQERLFLRVSDGAKAREIFLPTNESMKALGDFVAARVTWSPEANGETGRC